MSLRLRLVNLMLRWLVRPRLRRIADIGRSRREFALSTRLFLRPAPGVGVELLPKSPPIRRFAPPGAAEGVAILYFHGGGFTVGSSLTHRAVIGRLARASGMVVYAPDYRLAPEHPFPAAQDDARAAWDRLLGLGLAPGRIALAGDSAGGGLAFGLLAELCQVGTPPFAVAGFSPWVDLTGSGASLRENADHDLLLPAERFGELVGHALGGHAPADPRASPLLADFPHPPAVLLHASADEILLDDSRRLAERLRGFGGAVELCVEPGLPHAWQVMAGFLPEANAAIDRAAAFLRRQARAA